MFDDLLFSPRTPLRPAVSTNFVVEKVLMSSGFEHRNARIASPRKTYTFPIGQRPISELNEILDFFIARGGSLRGFRFRDPFGSDTAATGSGVTAQDVELGVGDDINSQFQLLERNGREIRKPVAGSVLVALDGSSLDATEYDVDNGTGLITLSAAPTAGSVVTAGCVFDTPVRFQNDTLSIHQTNTGAGEINDLVLIEVFE